MRQINYKHSTLIKLKNARVKVRSLPEATYGLSFKTLDTNPDTQNNPRSVCLCENGVITTSLNLSTRAAYALMIALYERLQEDGII